MTPRRRAPWKPGSGWRVLLLFLAYAGLAFVAMGANPFKGESITPLDVLARQHAWRWVDPAVEVRQPERTDIINGLLPTWIAARDQIRDGRFPTWNDTYAGGSTLLAPSSGIYTPAFLVFAATPGPALGFHLATILNLAIAGLGMHLFLRRRLGLLAALFGAASFQFCGFIAAWLYWPHVATFIWAPWLLLAIDRCAERPGFRRALPVAGASAMLILGGFPFVAELVFGMAALYVLVLWADGRGQEGRRGRFPLWCAAGIALGFALCALPLLELASFLQQYDLGYRDNRGSYLDTSYMNRLLPPWSYEYRRVEQTMYVGLVMVLLAIATAAATILRWRRSGPLARFGVLLLGVMTALVFDLVPVSLVGWFPGMGFNSWSRGIGVLGISLIVLGSLAIDRAWAAARSMPSRRLLCAGLALVVAAQVVEITSFFGRYNGPVSAAYFYPDTPATDYLREHAGPFDFVVADDSFHITGALGAYGMREWFGHQFRTPELRKALSEMVPKHFSSHTSSRFKASDIRLESPLMATMNVRYLALSSADPDAIGPGATSPAKHRPLPPMPAHHWHQQFSPGQPMLLAGISVRLATYHRSDLEGTVQLVLLDSTNTELARAAIDARYLVDNALADFYFPRPVMLGRENYGFSLTYAPPSGTQPRLTAWAAEPGAAESGLLVDGAPSPGVVEYVLHPGTGARGPFRRVLTGAGISVYENTSSPNGPYFVGSLDDVPDARSGRHVRLEEYSPERFVMRYSGDAPGFVVVPASMSSEWAVTVNGKPAKTEAMAGVMPAVPVNGPATIRFEYRPMASRWLAAWLASLIGVLLVMWLVDRRLDKRRQAGRDAPA